MNDPKQQEERKATMLRNVREGARTQATPECRDNYLRSCEAHGGDMMEVVATVRKEMNLV